MEKKPPANTWEKCKRDACRTADSIPSYMAYVTAENLVYRYVNKTFETAFSKPREEIVGSHVKDIIGQSSYEFALPFIEKVKSGKSTSYINVFGLAQGKRWIKVNYIPDFDEAGNVVGIFVHSYDVSDHQQAVAKQQEMEKMLKNRGELLEETVAQRTNQLRAINHELAKAKERYRTIADFTYDWETWEGPDEEMRYVSPACERISGYTPEEFVDDPALLRKLIHPEEVSIWDKHLERRYDKRIHELGPIVEFRIRHKNGEVRWIQHQCQPVTSEKGEYQGIRGSNRDVTNYKKIKNEAARQQSELAHISRVSAINELTASIAHELNQPLAAILCNAQAAQRFLSQSQPDLNEVSGAIEDIVSDERRADQVIKRLRKLLKSGESEQELLEINEIIREALAISTNEATNANVAINTNMDDRLPLIKGDRVQLTQVILNLTMNSIEALRQINDQERRISITSKCSGTAVSMTISDTGPGLPSQLVENVFKPFVTTKKSGLGIGLSICKTIVEAHGGRLVGKNGTNGGALFQISLPAGEGFDK